MDNTPDEVPDEVITQAKAAFARRSRGQIALLAWDSLVDEDAPPEDHRLNFEHPELRIEVRVLSAGDFSDLEGLVQPPASLQVELHTEQGEVLRSTQTMDGAFTFDHVPGGIVRLAVRGSDAGEVSTDWFRL